MNSRGPPERHIGSRRSVYMILPAISMWMEERPGGLGSVAGPGGATRESRLLEDLQIGDDVLDVCGIGNAAIGHAVALHLCLRVLYIGTQIIFVPNEVRPFHGVRVAEILKRRRLAADHALQAGSQRV